MKLEIEFEHAVGDFVMTAWDAKTMKPGADIRHINAWQVIERMYSEHCGGVRIQYVCRTQSLFGGKEKTYGFDPCELVAMPPLGESKGESE